MVHSACIWVEQYHSSVHANVPLVCLLLPLHPSLYSIISVPTHHFSSMFPFTSHVLTAFHFLLSHHTPYPLPPTLPVVAPYHHVMRGIQ